MSNIKLNEVFGISTDVPPYTYVDRQMLDEKFEHYLGSQKHIVVHGASKQGKSCLRKKNIDEKNCIIVQCLPTMENAEDIWRAALVSMGHSEITSNSKTNTGKVEAGAEGGLGIKLPLIGGVESKFSGNASGERSGTEEKAPIKSDSFLPALAKLLRSGGKRLVLEDFHYLPEEARKGAAFGLKALYEEKAYVVVVGIWSEQNLMTYYNGDLTGRIEEINLVWSNEELSQVLSRGEGVLNITFAPGLRAQMIESAIGNVGLLQRLAERVCMEAGIYAVQEREVMISDIDLLRRAREQIVSDIRPRYVRIAGVFKEGMRADSVLHLQGRIYNELVDADDAELIDGISTIDLLSRIQAGAGNLTIRSQDLTSVLDRIEKLQSNRDVTPLLVSYSKSLRKLFLNDREFIFYRKNSGDDLSELKVDFTRSEEDSQVLPGQNA